MKNITKGFTLAEILIAMGILGVLTVIMLPTFMRTKPNQEMLMLKKSYYLMSRAISEIINDDDFYPDNDIGSTGFANVNHHAHFHGGDYSGDTKFCNLIAQKLNVTSGIHCEAGVTKEGTFVAGSAPGEGSFTSAEGMVWVLPISNFAGTEHIYVDVNGRGGRNCFVSDPGCQAPDRFIIDVDQWGKVSVPEEIAKRYLASTNITKTYKEIARESN